MEKHKNQPGRFGKLLLEMFEEMSDLKVLDEMRWAETKQREEEEREARRIGF